MLRDITLVDRSRTHIWKPLLHSVAAGSLRRSQHELNYIAQAHWRHFRYRNGEMTGLDRVAKTITLAATQDDEGREDQPEIQCVPRHGLLCKTSETSG